MAAMRGFGRGEVNPESKHSNHKTPSAAQPPTKSSYRSKSRGPLPLVARLCEKVNDV